ncbi:MAG: type II toxin-antitoxin system HicB family antitoxin [Propionibacteriaceae bacterium]|jgi:predicted RNase H-like HicB family nuclease|nr:type II toxin-antitoxin system HicB family antitoxin [Propionibacteriaceae bacterium]
MVNPDHYTYRVHWSTEDGEFVATVAEFPSLSWLDDTPTTAMTGIVQLAHTVVMEMEQAGETPPEPIATKDYSGKFVVRIPPETHRELALDAAEQGVSLNALAASRLVAA